MQYIRILHLSDLHLSIDQKRDQDVVLQALFDDIKRIVTERGNIDAIVFSGDLIAKGKFSAENVDYALNGFFHPLLHASGTTADRLFLSPGNHDLNLQNQSPTVKRLLPTIRDDEAVATYLTEATQDNYLATGFEGFNSLRAQLSQAQPVLENTHYRAYKIDVHGLSIGFCCFNTAWKATGAPNDGDYGKLLLGRKQTDELVDAIKQCDLKLAIHHHPLSWLEQKDSYWAQRQFLNHFDATFHGHNHTTEGLQITGSSDAVFISNAGCLYQSREYFNGYSIVEFDRTYPRWIVVAREYFEERSKFDICSRYASGGLAEYPAKTKSGSIALAPIPSLEFIENAQASCAKHLLSAIVSDVAPKNLRSLFVDPPLSTVSQRKLTGGHKDNDEHLLTSLTTIISKGRAALFLGGKDSGKTTLLQELCLRALDFESMQRPLFCAYVDLASAGNTRASILDSLIEFTKGAYRRSEFTEFLRTGLAVVCLDNINPANAKQCQGVEELIQEFPKCRYYFSAHEDISASLTSEGLPSFGIERDVYYLHPFGRRETRHLTRKWFGDNAAEDVLKVDDLLNSLGKFNIPRTPFLISALLWLREKNVQFQPVNQAEILDALIDGILEKLSESKSRTSLDSTNKRHFLGELALKLHRDSSDRVMINDLDLFAADYFARRALSQPVGPFLEELKKKGILLEVNGHVCFKFDCIRAFFLSTKFLEPNGLLDEALTPEGFLRLGEELDYFTGRTRNRNDILRRSINLLDELKKDADLDLDLALFDDISLHNSPLKSEHKDVIALRIQNLRPPTEKREQLLDAIDARATRMRGIKGTELLETEVYEPQGAVPDFMRALQVCSSVLRNSELVDDAQLKRDVYERLSQYWSEVLIAVLISAEKINENPQTLRAIQSLLPVGNPEFTTYFIKIISPNVVISLILESMGTTKLQPIIETSIVESSDTVKKVIGSFLHFELGLPGRLSLLDRLLKEFQHQRFICEIIFAKLTQIYYFSHLHAPEEREVKRLLGEALSAMFSTRSHMEKTRIKQNAIAALEKTKLKK